MPNGLDAKVERFRNVPQGGEAPALEPSNGTASRRVTPPAPPTTR